LIHFYKRESFLNLENLLELHRGMYLGQNLNLNGKRTSERLALAVN